MWEKNCISITVPVNKDAEMQIDLGHGDLDGTTNSRIMIHKVAGFPVNIIYALSTSYIYDKEKIR